MNPDQIAQMLASGDKAKISEAQKQLQSMGYSPGGTDGRLGDKTSAAMKAYRDDVAKAKGSEDARLMAEAAKAKAESDRITAENDPTNRLTKMGTELFPYAVGGGLGTAVAHYGFGKPYAAADAAAKDSASRLAKAIQIDPGVREAQLDKMATGRNIRNAAQFAAPAALIGAGAATRNLLAPMFSDPQMQDIVKNVGTGENAAGMTMGVHQLVDMLRRGNPVDPVDEATIRSDAMRSRMTADQLERSTRAPVAASAPSPAIAPPTEKPVAQTIRNSDRLREAVKATGGSSVANKSAAAEHLLSVVNNGNRAAVAKALGVSSGPNLDKRVKAAITALATKPGASSLAAATLAAGLSWGGEAEAADGTPAGTASQIGDAATAAGVAGGATYGMGRLLRALSPAATQAVGAAATGMTPGMIDDMTNYTPDEVAQGRNWIARNIPAARHLGGGFQEAYDMATVPERRPADAPQEQVPPNGAPVNEFDRLVAASREDPELADLLRQAVMARLGGEQLGPLPDAPEQQVAARRADPMAGMLRNLAVR